MEKKCIVCGIKILRGKRIGLVNWERKKTCSNKCKWQYYSQLHKGKSYWQWTPEKIEQMSQKLKGRKRSEETKQKMSLFQKGRKHPWTSKWNREHKGEKSPRWRGGIWEENAKIRKSKEFLVWREAVLKLGNYTCIKCNSREKVGADHIKPFALYIELRFDLSNGQVLCKSCHQKKNSEDMRLIRSIYDQQ